MLKLRVVLSFAVAALVALTSLDGVAAQQVDPPPQEGDEPSYSGSGDFYDAGTPTTTHATPVPTKDTSSSNKDTSKVSAGDGVVQRWGDCGAGDTCVSGTYCKKLGNGMSLCYPG